jgi:hypothetical protein
MNAIPDGFEMALYPKSSAETPTLVLRQRPAATTPPPAVRTHVAHSSLDERLLEILDAPLRAIETPTQGFDRKERALGNLFGELSEDAAIALHRRLIVNFTCDLVARKFAGLAVERKQRLLAFLENHCCH